VPPDNNSFEWLATYISNATFTAPASGWYRLHVIGRGGNGGKGGAGRNTGNYRGGGGGGGGGSGYYNAVSLFLLAGETVTITYSSGRASISYNNNAQSGSLQSDAGANGNNGGAATLSAQGSGGIGGAGSSNGTTGAIGEAYTNAIEGLVHIGGYGGYGGRAISASKYMGQTSSNSAARGGSYGSYVPSTSSGNPGERGADAIGVSTGPSTALGRGAGGGGGGAHNQAGGNGGDGYTGGVVVERGLNTAPNPPTSFSFPDTIRGGQSFPISWSGASDPDGNMQGYYLERTVDSGSAWTQIYQGSAAQTMDFLQMGLTGAVQYRVRAYDTEGLTSIWYTSATQTVINNAAPSAPPSITVPLSVMGGGSLMIAWSASSDPDGNLQGYRLERSIDGGTWAQIYQGLALTYADSITLGWETVQYRVKAYDSYGDESGYATSPLRVVDNNKPPVITCAHGDIGVKDEGFTIPYTVNDPDGDAVTVTETLDGVEKRSYSAVLDAENTFDITGLFFMKLLNGNHTLKITATDAKGKSVSHTLTFTKAVYSCMITLSEPLDADDTIQKMVLSIARSIPPGADFQVLVTNNALDPSPAWEDITLNVLNGFNYVFANETAVNGNAFNFIVTANRASAGQGGFISSIGGAFE
jgi:hypothetical protein